MSYTDIKLNGETVTQIALADGTILWKKDVEPTEWSGLTLTNTSDEDGTLSVLVGSSVTSVPNLEYSSNGSTWTTATLTAGETTEIPVASGKSIMLRGTNTSGFNGSEYTTFNLDKAHTASGNLMSLVDYTNMDTLTEVPSYSFYSLFYEDANLVSAEDMNFGNVTSIGDRGCYCTFYGCTALTTAPDLSNVTTIGTSGCWYMYYNCSKLQTIYTPSVSTWPSSIFGSWVYNAGSSATNPIMYAPSQTVADLIPSGDYGYGNYTVKVIGADDPITVTITTDGMTASYQIDSEDAVSLESDTTTTVTIPSTATNLTLTRDEKGSITVTKSDGTIIYHDSPNSKTFAVSDLDNGTTIEFKYSSDPE